MVRRMDGERPPAIVVGLGPSAGALDAYQAIFRGVPPTIPAAFVVVDHLDPDVLRAATPLPIVPVRAPTSLLSGRIYVGEPGTTLAVRGPALEVLPLGSAPDPVHPIDAFFASLAGLGPRAVAVVLSGDGEDGVRGIQQVRRAGGLVVAQTPGAAL